MPRALLTCHLAWVYVKDQWALCISREEAAGVAWWDVGYWAEPHTSVPVGGEGFLHTQSVPSLCICCTRGRGPSQPALVPELAGVLWGME